jgi:glycosyltransferase involved in cell wall biosynthesis
MFHLNFLVLLLRPLFPRATRILVRQNGMLSGRSIRRSRLERFLYRLTYPRADAIVSQTRAMADEMRHVLCSKAKILVLRNPVDLEGIRQLAARNPSRWAGCGPNLLAVGRLSPEKGFNLLLEAFARVRVENPGANLVILGEGSERNSLQSLRSALRLESCVWFAGYVSDPESWFAGATVLVIPSRCEAFPNVLLEGAAAGLPIVATPCSMGMTELIRGQTGIWLSRDVSSQALARSLSSALATLRPGERFPHAWLAPFDLPHAIEEYETLILQTLAGVSG